jgi:folylpolyglutamate synthase/dihydrofolate synthase
MDCQSALSYLRGLEKLGYRFRLENTRELLAALGYDFSGEIVHIAGTNGKGSCAAALNAMLLEAGRSVGLYTSPELIDFTERIRVDGRQMSHEAFAGYTEQLKPLIDSMADKPTFFEATTALALKYFAAEGVDVMVLEVGMGGRLDSTNAVGSRLEVVTNVELDHTQYLGQTITDIAWEKAGIIHDSATLVTAAQGPALKVLEDECIKKEAGILKAGRDFKSSKVSSGLNGTSFTLTTQNASYELVSPMRGGFQAYNIACAVAAAELLDVSEKHIVSGVSGAYWPGRLDLVQSEPLVILDSAHNPYGVRNSMEYVRGLDYDRLLVVAAFSSDKDYAGMIHELSGHDVFTATRYQGERTLDPAKILEHVDGQAIGGAQEAVDNAVSNAESRDMVYVTGSVFLVGEVIGRWRERIDL